MSEFDMKSYARQYAAQYASGADDWFETVLVSVRRRQVLASLARHPHACTLEVGCGLEPLFAFATGWNSWTIVEPAPEFVAKARELAAATSRDVDVACGFLEELGAELLARRGPFDFIVVSSLLHEVPDPARLLAELHRLAAPSTIVHLNVPNVRSFHRLLALEMGLIQDLFEMSELERRFARTTRFDMAKLVQSCEAAGFEVSRSETYFVKPFTNGQMAKLVDGGVVEASVFEALERMTRYMPDLGAEMLVELRVRH